jgi:5-dehydro-2-deoxygluconokinase
MGGFLRGWLRDGTLEECCRFGNACGALVVSRHGCAPAMPTWQELQLLLSTRGDRPSESVIRHLDHVHWTSTRRHEYPELTVLAIDHRSQFEDLGDSAVPDPERIAKFKTLGLRALDAVARQDRRFGVLLDGRYGFEALSEAADLPYWIGRPIEIPQSRPLEFEGCADVAAEISSWPLNHVVKCLVIYHPDDPAELRGRQERQLKRVQCRGYMRWVCARTGGNSHRARSIGNPFKIRFLEKIHCAEASCSWDYRRPRRSSLQPSSPRRHLES